jgi:hypothetical protein
MTGFQMKEVLCQRLQSSGIAFDVDIRSYSMAVTSLGGWDIVAKGADPNKQVTFYIHGVGNAYDVQAATLDMNPSPPEVGEPVELTERNFHSVVEQAILFLKK